MPLRRPRVLVSLRRRGASRRSHGSSVRGDGAPSLLANRPTTRTQPLPHPSSVQPTTDSGRRLARGVPEERWPSRLHFLTVLHCQGPASMVRRGSLPALPRKKGGYRTLRAREGVREAEANAMAWAETPSRRRGRGSDARGRARASVVVAEVDRRCPAKTSGRSPFHPIWKRSRTVA
jgi:hypothetical protein